MPLAQENQARRVALVLTAIPSEFEAVRGQLKDIVEERHVEGTIFSRGRFEDWQVGLISGSKGNTATAAICERAIQHFQPELVIFLGVAGGIKKVRVGDVVAAERMQNYELGKADDEIKKRLQSFWSNYMLIEQARTEASKSDWLKRVPVPAPVPVDVAPDPRVYLGAVASGEQVITSTRSSVYQFITQNYQDSLAVDMEGNGFLEALRINPRLPFLAIRGISDLIDNKDHAEDARRQEIAAQRASAFAFEVLAHYEALPSKEDEIVRVFAGDFQKLKESYVTFKNDRRSENLLSGAPLVQAEDHVRKYAKSLDPGLIYFIAESRKTEAQKRARKRLGILSVLLVLLSFLGVAAYSLADYKKDATVQKARADDLKMKNEKEVAGLNDELIKLGVELAAKKAELKEWTEEQIQKKKEAKEREYDKYIKSFADKLLNDAPKNNARYFAEATLGLIKLTSEAELSGYHVDSGFAVGGAWLARNSKWVDLFYTPKLTAGKHYRFLAAGDLDARDVDLRIVKDKKTEEQLAIDEQRNAYAAVDFQPETDGKYLVQVRLFESAIDNPCACLVMVTVKGSSK